MIFPVQVYLQLSPVWITAFILLPFILKHSKSAAFSCLVGPFLTLIIMLYVYRSNVKDIIHIITYMIFIYWIQYIYNFGYIKQLPYTVCLQHMEVIFYVSAELFIPMFLEIFCFSHLIQIITF